MERGCLGVQLFDLRPESVSGGAAPAVPYTGILRTGCWYRGTHVVRFVQTAQYTQWQYRYMLNYRYAVYI